MLSKIIIAAILIITNKGTTYVMSNRKRIAKCWMAS